MPPFVSPHVITHKRVLKFGIARDSSKIFAYLDIVSMPAGDTGVSTGGGKKWLPPFDSPHVITHKSVLKFGIARDSSKIFAYLEIVSMPAGDTGVFTGGGKNG